MMAFLIAKIHNRLIHPVKVRNQNKITPKYVTIKAIILVFRIRP